MIRRSTIVICTQSRQDVGLSAITLSAPNAQRAVMASSRSAHAILLAVLIFLAAVAPCAAQDKARPAVQVAAVIEARSATATALPIRVGPANLVPRLAFVRIRGRPPTVALSEGHSIALGAWAVPLAALSRLKIHVPTGIEVRSDIAISLVSVEGAILDEAKSTLLIVADQPAPGPSQAAEPKASTVRIQIPQLAPGDRDRAMKMMQRGNELIASKDFSAAQHFYKRAADIGLPEAALALARTFDPGELARGGVVGLRPDTEMARTWYEKARALGSPEADEFLLRLGAVR